MAGEVQPDWMRWPKAVDYNSLRDELIELRRLRAAPEGPAVVQDSNPGVPRLYASVPLDMINDVPRQSRYKPGPY
ncbi:MAG TPA: hypothetical protein VI653_15825 [Steroidobacteraceae bacterium]